MPFTLFFCIIKRKEKPIEESINILKKWGLIECVRYLLILFILINNLNKYCINNIN